MLTALTAIATTN